MTASYLNSCLPASSSAAWEEEGFPGKLEECRQQWLRTPLPSWPRCPLAAPLSSFSPHQAVAKTQGSPELTFAGGGVFRGRRWGWAARSAWVWSSNGPRILPDVQGEFLLRGLVWNFIENIALTKVHCPPSTGGNRGLNASEGRDPLGCEAAGVSI